MASIRILIPKNRKREDFFAFTAIRAGVGDIDITDFTGLDAGFSGIGASEKPLSPARFARAM